MSAPKFQTALLGVVMATSLSVASPPAIAADHRDAPTIDDYSAIDINDVFLFRDPSDSSKLVVGLSTQAVADPLFNSSYHFQENALYRLNFTTRADAHPTATIDFVFSPFHNGPTCPTGPACQTYRAVFPNGVVIEGTAVQGVNGTSHTDPTPFFAKSGEITVFAGPREDPFFFDLVGFNRAFASGNATKFTGVDAFKGKNINAIVVEFPISMVFPANICTGKIAADNTGAVRFTTLDNKPYPCGAWAVTYLGNFNFDDPEKFEKHPEQLRQVDRMGNPAVNTALIPAAFKDAFNFGEPKDDPKDFLGVIANQILTVDKAFGTCPQSATSAGSCNPNVPLLASVAVPDTLKFAINLPDGFPNGRQLFDRTTDLLITLIVQTNKLPVPQPFSDGASAKQYCLSSPSFPNNSAKFPFLAPPLQLTGTTLPPAEANPFICP
jgi:uncharacterized protein DUF4331